MTVTDDGWAILKLFEYFLFRTSQIARAKSVVTDDALWPFIVVADIDRQFVAVYFDRSTKVYVARGGFQQSRPFRRAFIEENYAPQ